MSKTVNAVAGFVVGAVLIGIGIVTGNVALIVQGGAMIVTQAIVDLTMPKVPARQASEMVLQLGEQPRVMLIGETFTPGSLVDGFNYGGKYGTDWECLIIRLADHKCEGMTGFYVNDEYNPYVGNGLVPRYDDQLEIYFRSDTSTQTITSRVTDHGPGWTAADTGESGCDVVVCYKADKPDDKHPGWPGGRPHFGFVVKGALCYDPRLDDTVAGGSGSHRDDDPATWEWSENAIITRYKWVRGVYANDDVTDQSALLVGRGLSADEAPPENIIAAANLCDESVTALAPRYEVVDAPHFGVGLIAFSRDFTRFATADSAGSGFYALWDNTTRTMISTGAWPSADGVGGFVYNNAGTVWCRPDATHVCAIDNDFTSASGRVLLAHPAAAIYYCGGYGCLTALTGHNFAQLYDGATVLAVDVGFKPLSYLDLGGTPWALGVSGTDIKLQQIGGADTALTVANVAGGGATPFGLSNSAGNMVLFQGSTMLVIDTAGTILHSGSRSGTISRDTIINHDGSDTIWSQNYQYSLLDCSLLQTVTYGDWDADAASQLYDPINNALFGHYVTGQGRINWLFLGTPNRYRVAGPIYSNQDFIDVEQMFAMAIAGNVITHEGSVELEPAQAKSVVATITDDDLLVGKTVSWNNGVLSQSNEEWVNSVVARYVEPDQQWQDHAAPICRDTDDIIADGKPREASVTLRLVRDLNQAQRVAEINRRLGRLWGRASVTLGPRFCELEEGDWITWTSARYGFTKTFRVEAYSIDEKWQITLTLREIIAGVYADDWVFLPDNSEVTPSPVPPNVGEPDAGNWALAAVTLDSLGLSVPALEVTGSASDDDYVEKIIVEYWRADGVTDPTTSPDSVTWTQWGGSFAPTTTKVDITGLIGGATYYVAVSYVSSGVTGDRLVLGPATVSEYSTGYIALEDDATALQLEDGLTPYNLG